MGSTVIWAVSVLFVRYRLGFWMIATRRTLIMAPVSLTHGGPEEQGNISIAVREKLLWVLQQEKKTCTRSIGVPQMLSCGSIG